MKKKSISQNNTITSPKAKTCERIYNIREMKELLVGQDYVEKVAKELMDWADYDSNATKINKFYRKYKISRRAFDTLVLNFPRLAEAREYAMEAIGDRREDLSISGKGNPATLNHVMYIYCPEWRENAEYLAKIKAEAQAKAIKAQADLNKEKEIVYVEVEKDKVESRNKNKTRQIPTPRVSKTDH